MNLDLHRKVEEVLEDLGALLKVDGAELELMNVTQEGFVQIRLKGLCADCTDSMMALGTGIEKVLMEKIPEVRQVTVL